MDKDGHEDGDGELSEISSDEFRRRAEIRMNHSTNENYASKPLIECILELERRLGGCSDPLILETLQADIELNKRMAGQDRALFDAVHDAGDVFFEADDNRLCFYNSLSEAYYATHNFEGRQLSALEIWRGIRETLAAAALSSCHSTEKKLRILQLYAMQSDPANYMELDELAHSGAAMFLNMEILVATGSYVFSKKCDDAAALLGLPSPSGPSRGKVKLLLRGPLSHEDMGVKRHYNAALSQRTIDPSCARKRGQNNTNGDAEDAGGSRKNHRAAEAAASSYTPESSHNSTFGEILHEDQEDRRELDVSGGIRGIQVGTRTSSNSGSVCLILEEVGGNVLLKSPLLTRSGVATGISGVTSPQCITNLASVFSSVSSQLQEALARDGRGGKIGDAESRILHIQRELGPKIAALRSFSIGTGRDNGLLCVLVFCSATNVLFVYEEAAPGTVTEYLRSASGPAPLCVGLHSPAFDSASDLKINSQSKNWARQESQLRKNLVKSLNTCCNLGHVNCGMVTDGWQKEEFADFLIRDRRQVSDVIGRRVLNATPGISDNLMPALTSSMQAALQYSRSDLSLSRILLAMVQNPNRQLPSTIVPAIGVHGFGLLASAVRAALQTNRHRSETDDPGTITTSIAHEFLARVGMAPQSPSMQRAAEKASSKSTSRGASARSEVSASGSEFTHGDAGDSCSFGIDHLMELDASPSGREMSPSFEKFLSTADNRIFKVFECRKPDGVTVNTFAMPLYLPNGTCTNGPHVLVDVTDNEARCPCSVNSLAAYLPSDSTCTQGAEDGTCHHERVFHFSSQLRDRYLGITCATIKPEGQLSSYLLLDTSPHQSRALYVCIVCPEQQFRKPAAVLTITPGHVSCSQCHNGAKKHFDDPGHCPHAQFLKSLVENLTSSTGDLHRIQTLILSERDDISQDLRYDVQQHKYVSNSHDEKVDEIYKRLGLEIPYIPRRMSEIDPSCCRLSPQTQGSIPIGEDGVLEMTPPAPSFLPPLSSTSGCVYGEEFIKVETDEAGRAVGEGRAYFLSSSCKVRVRSRHCSKYHPECCIPFSGSTYGFHRQTRSTMVRYELPLLLWENNKTMGGPGTAAFVCMVEKIYTLAGSELRPEVHDSVKLALQDTTMRKCFISYHVRQGRNFASRKCPVCPGGNCTSIVADAKRMGMPVRFYNGTAPHIIGPHSVVREVRTSIMQRLFWPSDTYKRARPLASKLAHAVLKGTQALCKILDKDLHELPSIVPAGYRPAIVYLVEYFKRTGGICSSTSGSSASGGSSSEGQDEDELVDDDDGDAEGDNELVETFAIPELQRINHTDGTYVLVYTDATLGLTIKADGTVLNLPLIHSTKRLYNNGPAVGDRLLEVVGAPVCESLGADVTPANSEETLRYFSQLIRTSPRPLQLRFQETGCSNVVARSFAVQVYWICNKQCEPTQWMTASDATIVKEVLHLNQHGGFGTAQLERWRTSNLRRSVFHVVDVCKCFNAELKSFTLNTEASSLLQAMVHHVDSLRTAAAATAPRSIIPEGQRPKYDPTTGTAIHFTPSGEQLYYWPDFKLTRSTKESERNCGCGKPSWEEGPTRGLTNGILTGLCGRSGFHLLSIFLPDHEGCKHLASALYTHHPDPRQLQFVMTDTPCKHSTYLITRAPHEFTDVVHRGDTFHITPHTCSQIYSPSEYRSLDHMNTSLIEQWHAIMSCLSKITAGSTLSHAMFILQLLHDDHYYEICEKFGVNEATW